MKKTKKLVGADAHIRPDSKECQKNQTGITLIALVVTIIVLLILAGVSLSLVTGGNGILSKAEKAVEATNEATILEEVEMAISEGSMEYYLSDRTQTLIGYLAESFSPYESGSGAQISFLSDGNILYESKNGGITSLEMEENGQVIITGKDGSTVKRTVIYNASGGTGNVPEMQTVEYKGMVNVDFTILPTKEGYAFLGWSTTNNASSPDYSENGTKQFPMGTSNITLYAVWQDISVDSDNYGDSANYSANGVDDWKIFLNDGTNIYLIASDYVPNSGLNKATNVVNGDGDYTVRATDNRKTLIDWLTTESYWSEYAKGIKGATATGGPTILQFVESWNEKGYERLYTESIELGDGLIGYYVGNVEHPTSTGFTVNTNYLGYLDTLYFPHRDIYNDCRSYWLSNANPYSYDGISNIYYSGHISCSNAYFATNWGVRPLVKLPAGVQTVKNSNEKWEFSIK